MAWAEMAAAREARPHLLGVELEPFPYASAFSLLLRVTRLMDLEGSEWFRTLGLRCGANRMALQDFSPGRVSRARFETALGLSGTQVPTWWSAEVWSPLRTGGLLDRTPRPIRWCWHCASYGYHTMLFQLPSVHACPWHEFPLLEACPKCKRGSAVVDALGGLGRCTCGFDWLKIDRATVGMWSFPTMRAESWLEQYLAWASDQRLRRCMVAPHGAERWVDGYAALAELPLELRNKCERSWCNGTRKEDFSGETAEDPPATHFWGWGALGDERPLTYVPLPSETLTELTRVTLRVIAGLPDDVQKPLELASFSRRDAGVTPGENVVTRVECFIAPHGRAADGSTWLNVSAVDVNTLQLCGQLIDGVIQACAPNTVEGDYSRQASRTSALAKISGRGRLAKALDAILAKGYGQGLDALLRSALELPQPKEWWLPVAEFEGELDSLTRVRVCWVPVPPPRLRRTMTSPPEPPTKAKASTSRRGARRRSSRRKAPRCKEQS